MEPKKEFALLRGAISCVLNALDRDGEQGKPVRKEMADELRKAFGDFIDAAEAATIQENLTVPQAAAGTAVQMPELRKLLGDFRAAMDIDTKNAAVVRIEQFMRDHAEEARREERKISCAALQEANTRAGQSIETALTWQRKCYKAEEELAAVRRMARREAASSSDEVRQLAWQLLQDHLISEDECNSVDFDAIYGRYSTVKLLQEALKLVAGLAAAQRTAGGDAVEVGIAVEWPNGLYDFACMLAPREAALAHWKESGAKVRRLYVGAELNAAQPVPEAAAQADDCPECNGDGGKPVGASLLGPDWQECKECGGNGVAPTAQPTPGDVPTVGQFHSPYQPKQPALRVLPDLVAQPTPTGQTLVQYVVEVAALLNIEPGSPEFFSLTRMTREFWGEAQPTLPDDERAAFEAWAVSEDSPWPTSSLQRFGNSYVRPVDEAAWYAWQGRAALRQPGRPAADQQPKE